MILPSVMLFDTFMEYDKYLTRSLIAETEFVIQSATSSVYPYAVLYGGIWLICPLLRMLRSISRLVWYGDNACRLILPYVEHLRLGVAPPFQKLHLLRNDAYTR